MPRGSVSLKPLRTFEGSVLELAEVTRLSKPYLTYLRVVEAALRGLVEVLCRLRPHAPTMAYLGKTLRTLSSARLYRTL